MSVKYLVMAGALLLSTTSFVSHAEYVKTDWQEEGDKLALLYEGTGIEWLSLTQTDGMSINQVTALLDTTYLGWRLPTPDEVDAFMSAYIGLDFSSSSPDSARWGFYSYKWDLTSESYVKAMGRTETSGSYSHSKGLYMNGDEVLMSGVRYDHTASYQTLIFDGRNSESNSFDYSAIASGVFLVSDGGTTLSSQLDPTININNANAPINNVPVVFVSGFAALGLAFTRRRKSL